MIDLRNVSVSFPDGDERVHALRDVSFTAGPGEFVSLTGVSGSGKTTLLNVIAGLQAVDEGSASVAQIDLTAADESALALMRLHHVGVVFQENNLIREFTVAENVELPLRARGVSAADAATQAGSVLDTVGMSDFSRRFPRQLSGGQRQRVGIARALVGGRSVLVADEPTGSLDTANSLAVIDLLRRCADRGVCVVVASHDGAIARAADRVVHVSDGALSAGAEA